MNRLRLMPETGENFEKAWRYESRRRDERAAHARIILARCFCLAAVLALAALWAHNPQLDLALKTVVAGCAAAVCWQASTMRHSGFASPLFGFLALLFNPFLDVLSRAGTWKPGVLTASIAIFVWSGFWLRPGSKYANSR